MMERWDALKVVASGGEQCGGDANDARWCEDWSYSATHTPEWVMSSVEVELYGCW